MTRPLRAILGLGLIGYGLLVVLGILAHDALVAGLLSLGLGGILLATGIPSVDVQRASLVAWIGVAAVGGVLGYNLLTGSGLGLPEWALLLYGGALLGASARLDRSIGRVRVGTLVGWSFPLLLVPLFLFALNAILTGQSGVAAGTAASPIIATTLVTPMVAGLNLLGTPAEVMGTDVILRTERGSLTLGVGLVCAGLYPMVLFAGVLGLHAWREGLSRRRLAAYLGIGFVGLWIANLLRLVMLAKIGEKWGAAALQNAHAHLGWALFGIFMIAFWGLVLRRLERPPAPVAEKVRSSP